jgi:hypothetical protein
MLMGMGNKAKPAKKKRRAVRVSVNQNAAEPMHVLGQKNKRPEVGDILRVLPDRFQKAIFAKTVKIDRISVEGGVTILHATTY